jgi:hypothetical protein
MALAAGAAAAAAAGEGESEWVDEHGMEVESAVGRKAGETDCGEGTRSSSDMRRFALRELRKAGVD